VEALQQSRNAELADDQRLRQRLLDSLVELEEASDRVHDALYTAADAYSAVRQILETGRKITELTDVIDPIPLRTAVAQSTTDLERARHAAQRNLFQLLRAEGRTNAEIARTWGISRQLVSRLVNEP
jgi:hypothetical protein